MEQEGKKKTSRKNTTQKERRGGVRLNKQERTNLRNRCEEQPNNHKRGGKTVREKINYEKNPLEHGEEKGKPRRKEKRNCCSSQSTQESRSLV